MLKQEGSGLRVFEVLAGCGIRSKRYLQQVQGTANLLLSTWMTAPFQPWLPSSDAALVSNVQADLMPVEDQLRWFMEGSSVAGRSHSGVG